MRDHDSVTTLVQPVDGVGLVGLVGLVEFPSPVFLIGGQWRNAVAAVGPDEQREALNETHTRNVPQHTPLPASP